jgi:predicted nucleic acid-binding protein
MTKTVFLDTRLGFLENIAASPRVAVVYSSARLESIAESILRKYHDQDFSHTDAVSFAAMRDLSISRAFAFDKQYLTAPTRVTFLLSRSTNWSVNRNQII